MSKYISSIGIKKIFNLIKKYILIREIKESNDMTHLYCRSFGVQGIHICTTSDFGLGFIYSENTNGNVGDILFRVTKSNNSTDYDYTSIRKILKQISDINTKIANIEKKIGT